ALLLDAVALDLEAVRLSTLVVEFEGVSPGLRQFELRARDGEVLEDDRHLVADDACRLAEVPLVRAAGTTARAAAAGEKQRKGNQEQKPFHGAEAYDNHAVVV